MVRSKYFYVKFDGWITCYGEATLEDVLWMGNDILEELEILSKCYLYPCHKMKRIRTLSHRLSSPATAGLSCS